MQSLTLEKYQEVREKAIDSLIEAAQNQNNSSILSRISSKEQARLIKLFTHLKDKAFLEGRRDLYREMFDQVFMPNGELIQPTTGKKRYFLLASSYTGARDDLFRKLIQDDSSLPTAVRSSFKKVNNGHAVLPRHDRVAELLPEYKQAQEEKDPYAFSIVSGEVKSILHAMMDLAKQCGYNIIDTISTHSTEKTDAEIDRLKNISSNGSKSNAYHLTSIGLAGNVDWFLTRPYDAYQNAPFSFLDSIIRSGLKSLAQTDSFPHLMQQSDKALLLWDNGKNEQPKYQYTVVASAKKGIITFPRRDLWRKFEKFRDFRSTENPYLGSYSRTESNRTRSQDPEKRWASRIEEKNKENLSETTAQAITR